MTCSHKWVPSRIIEVQDPQTKEIEEYIELLCYECNRTTRTIPTHIEDWDINDP